jgi:tight adherence protein B
VRARAEHGYALFRHRHPAAKETGGNIAEFSTTSAACSAKGSDSPGKVKALTAEGRYSAGDAVIALPILMFIYVYFVNYDYISRSGPRRSASTCCSGAIVLQIVGAYVIKRIVTIEI